MSITSSLEFYLITLKPVTVFTGRVNGIPSDPFMTIPWDGGETGSASAVGTAGAPVAGNTVWFGSTDGGQERGTVRLRSWTPSDATGTVGGLSIAETDDVGPQIQDDDYITVKLEWRLWPIAPRLVQSGTQVEFYEDYDVGYDLANKQTVNWRPVAVPGPPAVEFLSGPTQASFVGDRSFALAPGATISSYLWTAHGSVEGTSAAQGTEAVPVTFTWNAAGQYLISLKVTDSNGNTHTSYTWAFIVDPDNPTAGGGVYTQFDAINETHDFSQGGGECGFTVHGVADVSQFPRECLVIHACRGTQTTATGSWLFRTNNLFTGYIVGNSIRQDSVHNTTSFRAVTIDGLMKNLSMHAASLRDTSGPTNWTMASDITVDRAASFLYHYRSTLSLMTPIRPLNYTAEIKRQDFSPTNLYQQLQSEVVGNAWAQVVSDHQSVLHFARDYNLMTTSERSAVTIRKLLHKGIWLDTLDIEERPDYAWPVRKVKMSGIYYPGAGVQALPYFSEAPGDVHKAFGREDAPGRLILTTQADLNTRCGLSLARQTQRWHTVRGRFVNDGSFTVAPQEIFPANVEAADNNRGLSWTPDLIPRRLRRSYDHQAGTITSEVEFEPSATGPAGVTVIMPSGAEPPRDPISPEYDPLPVPDWTPPIISDAGAAAAADGTKGPYWTNDKGATWEARNAGLGGDQRAFNDLIWDPWWFTSQKKGTSDPNQVILLGCGPGFIVRSENAGIPWADVTPYLDDPPNAWADSPAPTATDLTYIQIHGDIHNIDTFYVLAEWQNGGAEWRGWLLRTDDNFLTSEWQAISAGAVVCRPLATCSETPCFLEECGAGGNDPCGSGDLSGTGSRTLTPAITPAGTYKLIPRLECNKTISSSGVVSGVFTPANPGTNTAVRVWKCAGSGADILVIGQDSPPSFTGTCAGHVSWESTTDYTMDLTVEDEGCDTPETRPLAMDIDTEDGSRLYVTLWAEGDYLLVQRRSTDTLAFENEYDLSDATAAEIAAKTYYAVPRTPHFPGVANFGDIVYVFGRWDDAGTARHVARSTDGAETFSNIGDATWTTERAGAISVLDDGATIYVFLNSASPALWRSLDSGVSWAQINTLPFSVEFEAAYRHGGADAEFIIGNNTAAIEMGAFLETPYTDTWIGATGPPGQRLPTAADGGSNIASIVWI